MLIHAKHGLKPMDLALLKMLRQNAIPHQIVITKADTLFIEGRKLGISPEDSLQDCFRQIRATLQASRKDGPEALGELIACATKNTESALSGVPRLRWAVLQAVGLGA